MDNPTSPEQPAAEKWIWGVEEYATQEEVERAISEQLVEFLADSLDAGHVDGPNGLTFQIEVTAKLVAPTDRETGEAMPESRAAARIVDRLLG